MLKKYFTETFDNILNDDLQTFSAAEPTILRYSEKGELTCFNNLKKVATIKIAKKKEVEVKETEEGDQA